MNEVDCLELIVRRALFEKQQALNKLEIEESGRVVASLQGHIAGYKQIVLIISKEFLFTPGYISMLLDNSEKDFFLSDLDDDSFLELAESAKVLIDSELWTNVMEIVQERTEELKSFLLFKAEKSRDLDVGQGTYHGMTVYESFFKAIDNEAERREKEKKGKKEELPFDSDGPAGDPGVSSEELGQMDEDESESDEAIATGNTVAFTL